MRAILNLLAILAKKRSDKFKEADTFFNRTGFFIFECRQVNQKKQRIITGSRCNFHSLPRLKNPGNPTYFIGYNKLS